MPTNNSRRTPTFRDLQRALEVVRSAVHHTPMLTSQQISEMAGCTVLLKAENLQRTGSFKFRGALNKVASLGSKERQRGVVTASAGNHAQGVALAARAMGVACTVVMPATASLAKVQATRGYGAAVVLHGESLEQAYAHSQEIAQTRSLVHVHAFDDPKVIAGQGTLGIEICQDAPQATAVLVPIGGGGLIAGVALAVKALSPQTRVIGVQTTSAPAAERSFRRHRRMRVPSKATLADGIAVAQPGLIPWRIIRKYVDHIVTVSEEAIAHAQVVLLERTKLLVEGAGAVGVAALLEKAIPINKSDTMVAVLSGGNVDLNLASRILEHGLAQAGRYQFLEVVVQDKPGQLARMLGTLAETGVNVLEVNHVRHARGLPLGCVLVEITCETRDPEHVQEMVDALEQAGYSLVSVPMPGSAEAMGFEAGNE